MNKNFAIIEAGIVKNIIVIDDADAATISYFGGILIQDGTHASIGCSYDGLNFSASIILIPKRTTAEMWILIKAKRTQVKYGGLLVGAKWFHSDEESRSQYGTMYAAISVNSLPDAYSFDDNWKTMDGSKVAMTVALLKSVITTGMANEKANYANAETHRAAMLLSTSPEIYDFSFGWTTVYIP